MATRTSRTIRTNGFAPMSKSPGKNPEKNTRRLNAQLNRIAEDGLPEDVSRETVEDLCQALADQGVTDVVDRLSANTLLSTDEARARTLALFHDPEFTFISQDAKALFLSTRDGNEAWITPEELDELERNAERTIQKARDTVGEIILPDRNDDLDFPKIVWLESSTVRYLRSIATDDEQSFEDVVSRLVEAELTSVPVEDIVWATDSLSEKGRLMLVLGTPRFSNRDIQLRSAADDPR